MRYDVMSGRDSSQGSLWGEVGFELSKTEWHFQKQNHCEYILAIGCKLGNCLVYNELLIIARAPSPHIPDFLARETALSRHASKPSHLALINANPVSHTFTNPNCNTFEDPANRYSLLNFLQKKMLTMLFKKAKLAVILLVLSNVRYSRTSYCTQTENSIKGMMLRQYVFKTFPAPTSLGCLVACEEDVRCQSFNYIITQDICELNNRTKEARPEHFIFDVDRYYCGMVKNRGKEFLDWPWSIKHKVDS